MNWLLLRQWISQELGQTPGPLEVRPVSGGNINQGFRLEGEGCCWFLKSNRADHLKMFQAEATGLQNLQQCNAIRVPRVDGVGSLENESFILMEFIELTGSPEPDRMATALASLHRITAPAFGFEIDNTIGATPQINSQSGDWVEFWKQHRLLFQLKLAKVNGLKSSTIDLGFRLVDNLDAFFDSHLIQPALLHGDLWQGNYAADAQGNVVLYDPAPYYGDHEADLAMMELFGSPGDRFFSRYHEHYPISSDYPVRRELYNLYHLLNHANLFGASYEAQVNRSLEFLLSEI
ncbi:MAG: fructosamine kinase family protein [Pseudomonadota bacterium]